MVVVDFLVKFFLVLNLAFIIDNFIPEAIRDIKAWKKELFPRKEKRPMVYARSVAKPKVSFQSSYSLK